MRVGRKISLCGNERQNRSGRFFAFFQYRVKWKMFQAIE